LWPPTWHGGWPQATPNSMGVAGSLSGVDCSHPQAVEGGSRPTPVAWGWPNLSPPGHCGGSRQLLGWRQQRLGNIWAWVKPLFLFSPPEKSSEVGGRWLAMGLVANICEGELILCFAYIFFFFFFFCIFLRLLMCQNLCGVHKSSLLCTDHTKDTLIIYFKSLG
jgi:hypothetical protein